MEKMTHREFLLMCTGGDFRIVASSDLSGAQISELKMKKRFFVDESGLGWGLLDWSLTTCQDRERERAYFKRFGL